MAKYNLREKDPNKVVKYRSLVNPEMADDLYDKILMKLVAEKKYLDPDYSAAQMAKELDTNTRYISAVVNQRFQQNYSRLVNEYRIKDAMFMLQDKRYVHDTMEKIATKVGFANRQSFYAAFFQVTGVSPRQYKVAHKR